MDIFGDNLSLLLGDATSDPLVDDGLNFDLELQSILSDPKMDLALFDIAYEGPPADASDSDSGISSYGDRNPILGVRETPDSPTMVQNSRVPPISSTTSVSGLQAKRNPVFHLKREGPMVSYPFPATPPFDFGSRLSCGTNSPSILSSSTPGISAFNFGNIAIKKEHTTFHNAHQLPVNGCTPTKIPRILGRGPTMAPRPLSQTTAFYSAAAQPLPPAADFTGIRDEVPSMVNLPVIDEYTSSYFQPLPHPTEPESFDKIIKKQERMIKNRQAACLSRLRKKEYLERLEHRLDQLRQENAHLKHENNEWRHRYDHLEQCLGELQADFTSLKHLTGGRSTASTKDPPTKLSPPGIPRLPRQPSLPPPIPTFAKPSLDKNASPLEKNPGLSSTSSSSMWTARAEPTAPLYHPHHHHTNHSLFSTRSGGGSTDLPRGVRKKVTTSLFAVTCLLAFNIFNPLFPSCPQQQHAAPVVFDGAKNVGIGQQAVHSVLMQNTPVGGRTLLSVPTEDSPQYLRPKASAIGAMPGMGLAAPLRPAAVNRSAARASVEKNQVAEVAPCLSPPSLSLNVEKQIWPIGDVTTEQKTVLPTALPRSAAVAAIAARRRRQMAMRSRQVSTANPSPTNHSSFVNPRHRPLEMDSEEAKVQLLSARGVA